MNIQNTIIEGMKNTAAELRYALELTEGVIDGTPWVVQMCQGGYLVRNGEGFGVGSVLMAFCYSPERIDGAVAHIIEKHGDLFPDARKILRRDALRLELAAMERTLAGLEAMAA